MVEGLLRLCRSAQTQFRGLILESPFDREESPEPGTKLEELRAFLFMSVLLAPIITAVIVGGYGFFVWMSQLLYGPPTG